MNGLNGVVDAPPSKSHTHRAIIVASLAKGESVIRNLLLSGDCLSSVGACRAIGAEIAIDGNVCTISGIDGKPHAADIDCGNSGTTLRIMSSVAALADGESMLDGDDSLRTRPMQPLLTSLNELGAKASSIKNNGCAPISIEGKMKGGSTTIEGASSQFVSSLLIALPFAERESTVVAANLKSRPYLDMTLALLKSVGCKLLENQTNEFSIAGRQSFSPLDVTVPGDFSSAAFLLCAAAIVPNSNVTVRNLDMNDLQGDKRIVSILQDMGASISVENNAITVRGSKLTGVSVDLSNNPDLLPILAVVATQARGKTVLYNVEHARIKETDRIRAMRTELEKLNAKITERKDGLEIEQSKLESGTVESFDDHRIAMSLSIAGLVSEGKVLVKNSECVAISFPDFKQRMKQLGGDVL